MSSAIQVSPRPQHALSKTPQELQLETERMRDVLILLQSLAQREEVTIKLILDCLYDIGSVNLINTKVRQRPFNHLVKMVARMARPTFRFFAWRWFKKNCPQLIADWLYSQVAGLGEPPA